jgi:DNA-binding winged helix-turn-helix (wHTH) protein/Tol biopolymer transport system component
VAEVVRFGVFEANRTTGELRKGGARIRLQEQPFQILLMLLDRPGEVVTREEIQLRLWPDGTFVEFEHSIGTAVKKLRQALGDNADTPRYIETLPRRGFRFIASVESTAAESAPPRSETMSAPDSAIVGLFDRRKKAAIGSVAMVAALVAGTLFLLRRPFKPSAELTQKQLTFNSSENTVQSVAMSPDGKYLAYSEPAGVHVKLLSTSEERLIPKPAEVPAGAYWSVASWFPDGTQLLTVAAEPGGHKSMWTVSVLGQSPRRLRDSAVAWDVSPDGTRVAFSPLGASNYVREIWVMGSQGDNPQKVIAFGEKEAIGSVHWSPDGQRLAYIRAQTNSDWFQDSIKYSIETCDLKGVNRTAVVPDDKFLNDFYWLAGGRIVYARRDPRGSADGNLWQIGIDNHAGRPRSKPERITRWAGATVGGLSASADGKQLVILKQNSKAQVYLGELAAGGTRMKTPRLLTNDEADDWPTAWTADSKAVLFYSTVTRGIFKQGISEKASEPLVTGPQDNSDPRMSADGAWVLFVETPIAPANPAPPYRLMRISTSGGVPLVVLEPTNFIEFSCARAPASLCVIFETSLDQKHLIITAFDPLKGRGRMLRTIQNDPLHTYGRPNLSPDGSMIAMSREGGPEIEIHLLSPSGGTERNITVKGWSNITGLDWSTDGNGLYCGSVSPQGSTLLYVDLNGNARVLWQYKGVGGSIWGVPSPDGRYIALVGDVINSNVWMVQDF